MAVARVQRHEAGLQQRALLAALASGIGQRLQLRQLMRHRLVRRFLQPRVQRGPHHQSVGVDVEAAPVGPLDQPFAQVHRHVRRRPDRILLAFEIELERPRGQRLKLRRIELAEARHLAQHQVAPLQRPLRVEHRVVGAGALEHADQRCAFEHVELAGRLVEIGARGHLDAECVVQEGDRVQIGLEDLVLAVDRLDLQRRDGLPCLAGDGRGAADLVRIQVPRELLGDGRAALQIAAQRGERGRRDAQEVDAVVLVEPPVLGRDQRVDDVRRNAAQPDPLAIHAPVFGQHHAVRRHHDRGHLGLRLAQVGDAGRERDQRQQKGKHQQRRRQRRAHRMPADRGPRAPRQDGSECRGALESRSHGREPTTRCARQA